MWWKFRQNERKKLTFCLARSLIFREEWEGSLLKHRSNHHNFFWRLVSGLARVSKSNRRRVSPYGFRRMKSRSGLPRRLSDYHWGSCEKRGCICIFMRRPVSPSLFRDITLCTCVQCLCPPSVSSRLLLAVQTKRSRAPLYTETRITRCAIFQTNQICDASLRAALQQVQVQNYRTPRFAVYRTQGLDSSLLSYFFSFLFSTTRISRSYA